MNALTKYVAILLTVRFVYYVVVSLVRLLGYGYSARRVLTARKPQEYNYNAASCLLVDIVGVPITAVIGTPLYGRNTL